MKSDKKEEEEEKGTKKNGQIKEEDKYDEALMMTEWQKYVSFQKIKHDED